MKKHLSLTSLFIAILISPAYTSAIEVAFETDQSLPIVYLNIAVKAGAVTDLEGKSGLTNFLGEMLLRGTTKRNKEQIDIALDQIGATLEVETRAEALILRGAVLASQLNRFLEITGEIITSPSFPENEIRKLKSEIISSIMEERGRDSALAMRRFTQFMFGTHPYGKPVLGKIKDVQSITRQQLLAHYNRIIHDQLLLVIGSGDTAANQIDLWAAKIANERPSPPDKSIASILVSKPIDSNSKRLQLIDKPERTQTQINLGQVGVRMTDPMFFPLYLGNHAFGGGSFSARLMVEIRVKRGWSYGANSFFRHGRQPRSWQVHLFPAAKDTPNALAHTLKMIEELREKGISQEEFAFAKKSLINSAGFLFNTPKKRVENKLLERTLDLPDGFMKSYGPELQKVQLSDVNSTIKHFFKPESLAISVLCTAKDIKDALLKAAGVAAEKIEIWPYTAE
ncbi:MAG: pitrilysin family protein [Bdellovibrionota bacterium]